MNIYVIHDWFRRVRLKDSDFFNLFEKPEEYKYNTIEPILNEWKKVKFILVGDSGEKDPEAYARLALKFPNQVSQIFIRIAYEENLDDRIAKVFEKIPKSKYRFFKNVQEIKWQMYFFILRMGIEE